MDMTEFAVSSGDGADTIKFTGYQLGTVLIENESKRGEITSYFVAEDEEGNGPYILSKVGHELRSDYDEYSYLSYFGIHLGFLLLWQTEEGQEDRVQDFFPHYAKWGM
jgi:hypothetical protein